MDNSSLVVGILILLTINGFLGQDFVFPDQRPSHDYQTDKNISTPGTSTASPPETTTTTTSETIECPKNMILARESNDTENFCECVIGNLYHAKTDSCFQQYTIGPCEKGEHFVIRRNRTIAECVRNPCGTDQVLYKDQCHDLYVTGGPCESEKSLTIPETSYEPECVDVSAVSYSIITAPLYPCAPGSRRTARGLCREEFG